MFLSCSGRHSATKAAGVPGQRELNIVEPQLFSGLSCTVLVLQEECLEEEVDAPG